MASSTLGFISRSTIAPVSVDDIIGTSDANPVRTKSRVADSDSIAPHAATASPDLATVAMMLPPLGDFGPVAARSSRAKLQSAAETGLAESARDTSTSVGKYLGNPKHQALVAGGIGAFAAIQALPGLDGATDAAVGAVGAAMYASAGPEHKAYIEKALGEFKQYASGAAGAISQHDLDAAAHHFAAFLEIGGPEAAGALGILAAAPLKLGGIAGKAAALSDDALSAGAKGLTNAGAAAQRGVDAANHWLGEAASSLAPAGRPALAPAGAGSDIGIGTLESRGIRPHASLEASSTRNSATATDRRNVVDHDVAAATPFQGTLINPRLRYNTGSTPSRSARQLRRFRISRPRISRKQRFSNKIGLQSIIGLKVQKQIRLQS